MITEIGHVSSVDYNPAGATIKLNGEYGVFRFEADAKVRNLLQDAIEDIEDHQ